MDPMSSYLEKTDANSEASPKSLSPVQGRNSNPYEMLAYDDSPASTVGCPSTTSVVAPPAPPVPPSPGQTLLTAVVSSTISSRASYVPPATTFAASTYHPAPSVHDVLFSPATASEIRKARARIEAENASKHTLTSHSSDELQSNAGMKDLESAKKAVTDSSTALAARLINISEKRKLFLSRRRNSIKEKTARAKEAIGVDESFSGVFGKINEMEISTSSNADHPPPPAPAPTVHHSGSSRRKSFVARPLPLSNSEYGTGGQCGVPKINKRPATVPNSPMLGFRRKNPNRSTKNTSNLPPPSPTSKKQFKARPVPSSVRGSIKIGSQSSRPASSRIASKRAIQNLVKGEPEKKQRIEGINPYKPFKARPLPSSNGDRGSGGVTGVPKMPKRSSTIPKSPKLGVIHLDHTTTASSKPPAQRNRASVSTSISSLTQSTAPSIVKKSALNAKPFERNTLTGGSQASLEIAARIEAQKKKVKSEMSSKANGFKARPLPKTTTAPPAPLTLRDPNSTLNSVPSKTSTLKSTVRSRQRALFEAKRLRAERARHTKEEIRRIEKCLEEKDELEVLREQIKMPR